MGTVTTLADANLVGDNEEQLVTMIVDNQLFGIPILQVQDIVEASKITPVPLAPSAIAGVLNLRGRIVTVIDLRKLMGNHEEVPWDSQMGVTVEYKGDLYTLLVDAIGDVRSLAKRDYDKTPSTMEAEVKRLCSGIYRLRGNLLVVLDVGRILKHEVISATPMLTVEERKKRKAEAMQDTSHDEGRARQLSALMNDLRAYEAENAEAQLAGSADATDDMKSRKKANRARRPVADRWREVLSERERQQGKVVYRMREPDEEALEDARRTETDADITEPVAETPVDEGDALWQARVRAPETEDEAAIPAEQSAAPDDLAAFDEDDGSAPESDGGEPSSVVSSLWNKLRGKDGDEAGELNEEAGEPDNEPAELDEEAAELVDDETAGSSDEATIQDRDVPEPEDELKAADDIEAADAEPPSGKDAKATSKPSKSAKPAKSTRKAKPATKRKKK